MRPPPKSRSSHRPSITSLLPLAAPVEAAPSADALARIEAPARHPFTDLSSDTRLARWTRSSHVFPAAYPRSIVGSAVRQTVLPAYTRAMDRVAVAQDIRARNLDAARRTQGSTTGDEPQLFIAAARYFIPAVERDAAGKDRPSIGEEPLTLILTHANGFHKETWEPFLADLILSPGGRQIQEIWALDCVHHGDSAVLNRHTLGLNFDWADNSRDLMNFVLSYLPDHHSSVPNVPLVLPRLACATPGFLQLDSSPRSNTNQPMMWRHRRLGLIGHSLGGCASMLAATSIPELFHELVLVDPAIRPQHAGELATAIKIASSAVSRQSQWESRPAALRRFQNHASFFGRWDPRVLDRYVEHALQFSRPAELKCNKLHEASVFTQPHNRVSEAYYRFLDLTDRTRCDARQDGARGSSALPFRVFLVLANAADSIVPEELVRSFRSAVRMSCSGHLIVQEAPAKLAALVSEHLTGSDPLTSIDKKPIHPLSKL